MSVSYYIARSEISGKGIFANEDIGKGEIVCIMKGEKCHAIHKSREDAISSNPDMVGIGKNYWMNPVLPISHMNHSCIPNLGVKGSVLFVALRNIKRGEELTFDYSISEDDELWEMVCTCKSKNCRKIIRSIKYLPVEIFIKYLPYIPQYFQRVYKKHYSLK